MPTYTFRDNETQEVYDRRMGISEKEEFLKQNPQLTQLITGKPPLVDSVRIGIRGTDDGFKEVISRISRANYKSNLSDKLSRR